MTGAVSPRGADPLLRLDARAAGLDTVWLVVQGTFLLWGEVAGLTVFQRTGNWFLPRKNRPYPPWVKAAIRWVRANAPDLRIIENGASTATVALAAELKRIAIETNEWMAALLGINPSAAAFVGFLLIPGWSDRIVQVEVGYALAALLLCALLHGLYRRAE